MDGGTLTPALDQKQAAMRFLEIASRLGGQVVGPAADFEVRGVTTLEEAGPGWMSFITSARFLDDAKQSRASGFLATAKTVVPDRPCIVLDNVWKGMLFLLNRFHVAPQPPSAIHPTAVIGADVSLGREVSVGPYVVIEDGVVLGDRVRIGAHGLVGRGTRIGADSILHPRVTVLHDCEIGERVILHPGAVIGADGFKYEFIESRLTKIPQIGRVVLEDDVEVGANTTIDRASFTETRVCRGVKIDNLCMIAHNVRIGAGTVIVSQAGIAGSTRVGENCLIAGQAGIADNLEIGDRAKIGAKAGVKNDVPPDVYYLGSPAMPAKHFMRICADLNHLNEMRDRLRRIELRLEKQDEGTQGT